MKISQRVINNRLLKKIKRIEALSESHQEMVKGRMEDKRLEKPVDLQFKIRKINLYFLYSSESYSHIHEALEKAFKKKDTFNRLENLKKSQKKISHLGWHHIGYIFPTSTPHIGDNILLVDDLPKHVISIGCKSYKILPSISVLVFDIYLKETFKTDLYEDFYSPDDIKISVKNFFKSFSMIGGSSSSKFDKLLKEQVKLIEIWILKFFKINPNSILSSNSSLEVLLENISQTKSNEEIIERNTNFFFSQSASIHSHYCFHKEDQYYVLKNIEDIRLYTFEKLHQGERVISTKFATSIWLLMVINAYQNKLEDILEKGLDNKKVKHIQKLKDDVLLCNTIEFQILRFFEEVKNSNLDEELFRSLKTEKLKVSSNYADSHDYADSFKLKFSFSSAQLTEKSQLIKKYLEKEFDSVTTEVNFELQKEMKYLTRVAIFIAMLSVAITCLSTDWNEIEKKSESFKTLFTGAKTNK